MLSGFALMRCQENRYVIPAGTSFRRYQLRKLADDLRRVPREKLLEEYRCVCNGLSESDGISDFQLNARDFREMIGFGEWADIGEDYVRTLIRLAHETFGMG